MKKRRHFTLLEVLIALSLSAILLTAVLFFYRYLSEMSQAVNQVEIENFQARRVETRLAQAFYAIVGEPYKSDANKAPAPKNPMQDKATDGDKKVPPKRPDPKKPAEQEFERNPNENKDKDQQPQAAQPSTVVFFTGDDEGGILKTGSASLTFIFDNGPTMNTPFANQVLAKLFVDKQNRLCLAYWPHPKFWGPVSMPPMNLEVLMENVDSVFMRFYVPPVTEEKGEVKFPELRPGEWMDQWHREYGSIPPGIRLGVNYFDKQGRMKQKMFAYPLIDSAKVIEYQK